MTQYRTIVADPPWPFQWSAGKGGRRRRETELGYRTLTVDEIAALPVGDLADPDGCHLFLWSRGVFGRPLDLSALWARLHVLCAVAPCDGPCRSASQVRVLPGPGDPESPVAAPIRASMLQLGMLHTAIITISDEEEDET